MNIAVVVTARPSWAKLFPVVREFSRREWRVDRIACAYALLHRYGAVIDAMEEDGYPATTILPASLDGLSHETSALTTGLLAIQLGTHFASTKPDAVVVCADRHETLAASLAAAYQHIPLVHLQGGEHTGSIDDKVRWANTALADLHCVSTEHAERVVSCAVRLAFREATVVNTGCPSIDLAKEILSAPVLTHTDDLGGTGASFSLLEPFSLVAVNPDTNLFDITYRDLWMEALRRTWNGRSVIMWPGADANAEVAAKFIRMNMTDRERHIVRNLPPRTFLTLLSQASCTHGNSSAFVREGRYLGVPHYPIGERQRGRQGLTVRKPAGEDLMYGDGTASVKIADAIGGLIESRTE